MTADPRREISDSTEIPDSNLLADLFALTLTVAFGGLAGSAFFLFVAAPVLLFSGIAQGETGVGFGMALFSLAPFLTAAEITLFAMLFVGAPITWALKRLNRERVSVYMKIFGALGPLIAFGYCWSSTGSFGLATLATIHGLLAGLASGCVWGRHRDALVRPSRGDDPDPPTNPYHDMIY
ncbi:hypothetical protein [Aurantiacibacter odishensis]|uniref:hypothetical protein n=1 Tax=Aurantiacibacter odishensis TaxID=1155476 RepID=UPI000E74A2CE|nr:hypothetical protein [Aurantiacibacter odishensis]